MALVGFIESIQPFQLRGWAYEVELPDHHVEIQIFHQERLIAAGLASLFRDDLADAGIGSGDHAFVINLDSPLTQDDLLKIVVFALTSDGSPHEIAEIAPTSAQPAPIKQMLQFSGHICDTEQYPVFILGAARSGTSAIAQGLLALKRFDGHEEGHSLDLIDHLWAAKKKFYDEKADDAIWTKNTAISRIPEGYIESHLRSMFIQLVRELYPSGSWLDKTPNPTMISLAPLLRSIWPNSRFIFMKRRAIENLASRAVKFPTREFREHCLEWSTAMSNWVGVKHDLAGVALEIDQKTLENYPSRVSDSLKQLLDLTDNESLRLTQTLSFDRPERTAVSSARTKSLEQMGWPEDQIRVFNEVCSSTMRDCGYCSDTNYFQNEDERVGLIWI